MAGSFGHVVANQDAGDYRYIGTRLLENGGDRSEAVEEMYGMIMFLSDGDPERISEARRNALASLQASDARQYGTVTAPLGS